MIFKKLMYTLMLTASVAVISSCGKSESPPGVPTGLSATGSTTNVQLTWSAVDGAVGYTIFYNTTGGVTKSDSSAKIYAANSYTHDGLSINQTYYYRVSAFSGGGDSDLSDEISVSTSCVAVHEGASWTKSTCDSSSLITLDQGSTSDTGETLGSRALTKGKISFKMSNITDTIHFGDQWNFWFLAHTAGGSGGESNFQLMVLDSYETRFIMQRFDDFSACSPRGLAGDRYGCEEQNIHHDLFMDPNKTFVFECQWNMNNDYRVSCDVSDTSGNALTRYESSMGGGYAGLKEFKVGTFSIYGYPSVPCTISDFRFSVM